LRDVGINNTAGDHPTSLENPSNLLETGSLVNVSGTLREKYPGIWEVRFDAGNDPVTGRRRQLSRSVRGSKREAQKVLNALVAESEAGKQVGTSATYRHLCERWLTINKKNLGQTTMRTYRSLLENHVFPALGDRQVSSIQSVDLDNLYEGLSERMGLSASTVRQIHAIIRRSMRQAVLWGWIATNPGANATAPRQVKSNISPPSVDEVSEILRTAYERDEQLGNFFRIAATTGARRGELCALHWNNLNTELATLTIEHSIIEVPGGLVEKGTKTHANRRIAIDPATLDVFKSQRQLAEVRAAIVDEEVNEDSYIFSHEPDGSIAWTPGNVTKKFANIKHDLGYDNMRLHDLRHFAATRLMAAGVPVRTVSGRLGHANPATTLVVYTHFVEASDQDAANIMGRLVTVSTTSRTGKSTAKKAAAKKGSQSPTTSTRKGR
jgi:integrase